jgi:hypothetical protein
VHDVPPEPGECEAMAGLTELTMETPHMKQAQARADQAKRLVAHDRLFNLHTRFDQCSEAESQLIYRIAEDIRRKHRSQ